MVHFGKLSVNFQLTMSVFLMNFAILPLILRPVLSGVEG
jgi:hypothetical protein